MKTTEVPFIMGMLAQLGGGGDFWLTNLLSNMAAYMVFVLPAGLLVNYLQKNPHQMTGNNVFFSFLRTMVLGQPDAESEAKEESAAQKKAEVEGDQESFGAKAIKLLLSAAGLQGSYLTWGVLQERIMTQQYGEDNEQFTTSQYLVFVNRVLAFVAAVIIINCTEQPKHKPPLFKYSFTSMSNIMSSWFQYEALKYVSFPTQVLAKASKVIPVMLMGKVVQKQTYESWEYLFAGTLSLGVAIFMFSKAEDDDQIVDDKATSVAGIICLVGYMMFDSFTSNYQSGLFKTYQMSKFQMMFGINLFSCFFTLWSLSLQGQFLPAVDFTFRHPDFMFHTLILSITSATGQIFIFHTISTYGALVFTIIMTTRQVVSIFLSAMIFGHKFSSQGWLGVAVVAGALFAKVYFQHQSRKARQSGGKK